MAEDHSPQELGDDRLRLEGARECQRILQSQGDTADGVQYPRIPRIDLHPIQVPQLTCEVDLKALDCLLGVLRQGVTQVLSGSEISPTDLFCQQWQKFVQGLLRLLLLK